MSIPKVIHYCWFGDGAFPDLMRKCMASWKEFCPDYEIIEWNESNVDLDECAFARDAAEAQKWAFVSDFVRNKVIYEHGGIYLDTDVMLVKSLDPLLEHHAYMGWEEGAVASGLGFGAERHHPIVKEFLDEYVTRSFYNEKGEIDPSYAPAVNTDVLKKHGLKMREDVIQEVDGVTVYPREYFCPYDIRVERMHKTKNTYSIHWYTATWTSEEQRAIHDRMVRHRRMAQRLGKRGYKIWAKAHGFLAEGGWKDYMKNRKQGK